MNIINRNTKADARVEEISGVAYIFNQGFFQDLKEATGIDLENIVYYKDETHYFVMTAKKKSLLLKGVLKKVWAGFLIETDCPSKYVRDASSILVLSPKTGGGGRYSLICKEGSRFSMWWCIEGALLPTLLRSLQRYYPNITFIWDDQICMFAVLIRFTLSFVYKLYIGFLSRICVTVQLL